MRREDGSHPAAARAGDEIITVERLIVHGRYGNPVQALRELEAHLPSLERSIDPQAACLGLYARASLMRLAGAGRADLVAAWTRMESTALDEHQDAWTAIARAQRARTRLETGEGAAAMGDLARIDLEALADHFDSVTGLRLLDATAEAFSRARLADKAEHSRHLLEATIARREPMDRATHWAAWSAELATRAMEPIARGALEPDARLLDRAVELADRVLALGVSPVPEPLRRVAHGVQALAAGYRGHPTEALRLLGSDAFGEPVGLRAPESQLLMVAALHAHTLVGSHATARSLDDSVGRTVGALPSVVLEVCRARERLWLEREAGSDPARATERLTDLLVRLAWQSMELVTETSRQSMEHQALHTESRTDALTGIGNRRALDEDLAAMLRFSRLPLAMVLIDIDDFKRVNDQFTHLIGDEVLRQVAGCLEDFLGAEDRLVRYGGDEFVVLLAERSEAEARAVAERMMHSIATLPWDTVTSGLAVTATAGCATLYALTGRRPDADAARLFRRADESLLEAKRRSRERVAPPSPATEVLDLREFGTLGGAAAPAEAARARHMVGDEPADAELAGSWRTGRRPGRRAAALIDLTSGQDRVNGRE